jgi:hypothetical protein
MMLLVNNPVPVVLIKVTHVKMDVFKEVRQVMTKAKEVLVVMFKANNLEAARVKVGNKVVLTKTDLTKVKQISKVVQALKINVTLRAQVVLRTPQVANSKVNRTKAHNKELGPNLVHLPECFNR